MDIGLHFGEIEYELGVMQCTTHFLDTLNLESIRAVYEWAKGEVRIAFEFDFKMRFFANQNGLLFLQSFLEIMKHTELQEGIMVRCIQRVDELLKNIRLAAKNLESKEFEEKLERASRLIRRDIVFAPSLYTVQDGVVSVFEEESRPQEVKDDENVEDEKKEVVEEKKKDGEDSVEDKKDDEEAFDEEEEEEDDALFSYNFQVDETLVDGSGDTFQEEEQFNSNFL